MEISIPRGSPLLEQIRKHAGRDAVVDVTDRDIAVFIIQATDGALAKHETEARAGEVE